jgi:hypothetical protein
MTAAVRMSVVALTSAWTLSGPAAAVAHAQRACEDRCPFAASYDIANMIFHPSARSPDVLFGAGRVWVTAPAGRWQLRTDALAGLSLWSSLPKNLGYLLGLQAAGSRVVVGEYLGLGPTAVEIYVTGGGGAYYAWGLQETPADHGVVPIAFGGLGLRFQQPERLAPVVLLELTHEERIGVWSPIVLLRLSLAFARAR